MNVLIVFGSTEGQTKKICRHIADRLRTEGHAAQLRDSATPLADLDVASYDAAILAASVHQKIHQESLKLFATAHRDALMRLPALFISVSLSAAFPEGKAEAQSYVSSFLKETGWTPTTSLSVAGALRPERYDYFMEQIVRHVVLRGHPEALEEFDHEFTDWKGLDRAVDGFIAGSGG